MAENFGALDFPAPPAAQDAALTDPCLDKLLACFKAIMNDGPFAQAWAIASPASPKPVVATFANDPTTVTFAAAKAPALFLYRTSDKPMQRDADEYVIAKDVLQLVWLFPTTSREKNNAHTNICNAITKVVYGAILAGRSTAWIDTDDDEPQAQYQGSFIWQRAGLWSCRPGKWSSQPVFVEALDGSRVEGPFEALQLPIEIEERYVPDHVDMLAGQATLQIPDEPDPFVTNEVALDMP